MSTKGDAYAPAEFLDSILPNEGTYALFVLPGAKHIQFKTRAEMPAKAAEQDAMGMTVYHACSTYTQAQCIGPDGKPRFRVQINVKLVKSFWLDLDCGPDKAAKGAGYRTKKEAAQALKEFCKAAGLPSPTWIVDSGNGLHVYWALEESTIREPWEATTGRLKLLCQNLNFLADPSRTTDAASVLRLPGTTNRKDPANPKPVRILHKGKPVTLEAFDAALCAALARLGEGKPHEGQDAPVGPEGIAGTAPAWVKAHGAGSIIEAAPQARQHTLEEAEEDLRYIDPDLPRDEWRAVLAGLKHEFGEAAYELARRWSMGALWKGGAA
ncbi:PriCT-2 domain-containing protein [Zoogloea sp.]|uniref:PriCT-2 domain-containing protein n=1 Tax=Zoogloea sp. TaxID=49181 RepID=UPI0035B44EAD